jgi:hypothetical protein
MGAVSDDRSVVDEMAPGELKAGQLAREIWARLSTMSVVFGHGSSTGRLAGRACMYPGERFTMKLLKLVGKQSRSKTKAARSWPQAGGMSIQLPTHHGLLVR